MKNSSGKSIKALRNIFSVIVILISVFVIAFAGIVDKSGKSLFGYGAFTVSSENLSTGDFSSGDVIVTKAVPASVLKSEDMIAFLTRKCTRPKDMKDVADWVKKNLSERLLLHERAEGMLSGTDARETDTGLVLDALEYLAEEFYDMQFHGLGKDDANLRSSKKYGRPFEFTPVSEMTYNDSGLYSQYHVSYKKDGRGKPVDHPLDMHIKCGNTSPFLVRIYFFLDKEDKKSWWDLCPDIWAPLPSGELSKNFQAC